MLLPDGRVVGTSSGDPYPEHVTILRLQRFMPQFVWYAPALG